MKTITSSVDRIQLAASLIVQLEKRIHFPNDRSIIHPTQLAKQAQIQQQSAKCVICSSKSNLEQHHIAGRANLPDTITVCKECHNELSCIYQPKWLLQDGERNPQEYYFLGLSDLFHLFWIKTQESYFHELAKVFALNARYQQ